MRHVRLSKSSGAALAAVIGSVFAYTYIMRLFSATIFPIAIATTVTAALPNKWYPPAATWINNLTSILNDDGVHGFIFNSSALPSGVEPGRYNWCNMPHVHHSTYIVPSGSFELVYVEVVHRHHKRTPYQDNAFPSENYPWNCPDQGLFHYGELLRGGLDTPARVYWKVEESPANPFHPPGFRGDCQFPQITHGGLDDSWKHGKDLYHVYGTVLNFLPKSPDDTIVYRVTNNPITSQVAGMLIKGMFGPAHSGQFPLSLQPSLVDSLEPGYGCSRASTLYSTYAVGSEDPKWRLHLEKSRSLFSALDAISGIPQDDEGFHKSFDHYFDNLSSRQCHQKLLPCAAINSSYCITQRQADSVYRLGQYEYSYIYRDSPLSLEAAIGSYGVWAAELVHNIRSRIYGNSRIKYRHNIAHDGSISRLLSLLQLKVMVWPGMGAEVVFEVYRNKDGGNHFVRVLWGGRSLESSHPSLGQINMIRLEIFIAYLEGLVGHRAERVSEYCT